MIFPEFIKYEYEFVCNFSKKTAIYMNSDTGTLVKVWFSNNSIVKIKTLK